MRYIKLFSWLVVACLLRSFSVSIHPSVLFIHSSIHLFIHPLICSFIR